MPAAHRGLDPARYFLHVPFVDEEVEAELDFPWGDIDELDVLVPNGEFRRNSSQLACHVWGLEPPPGAFRLMGIHTLISSPEFVLCQLAEQLDRWQLLLLACEFAGTYTPDEAAVGGLSSRPPLITRESLAKTIECAGAFRGVKAARFVLAHLVENAASPREAQLALLMSLPRRFGGYGLPKSQLNPAFPYVGLNSEWRYGDLYWSDARIVMEYDSDAFHSTGKAASADATRRNELMHAGIQVITITNDQIHDVRALDQAADIVRQALCLPSARCRYDFASRQRDLRYTLLRGCTTKSK